jgi:hypothetical protein
MPLGRTYKLTLQEQENWSEREDYSLGADLEDVEDLKLDQLRGGLKLV